MGLGALISYLSIIGNTLFGVFVTPFILRYLGVSDYGVYKTMGSLSASLLILDLGIGGTLMRYIAKYRANDEKEKIGPFVTMMLCECMILIPVIIAVEGILYSQLDRMYAASFSVAELVLAKQIFIILSVNILLNIVEHFLNGIITGHNDFIFGNGIKLAMLVMRILLILILLPKTRSAVFLVSVNLALILAVVLLQAIFIRKHYDLHLNFHTDIWDRAVFRESFAYTALIFLTTIAAQVNNNLDNVIVGAFCGTAQVTVYSFGLVIFGMFEQLSTAISGVALPTVSQIIAQDNWKEKVQDFVVKLGRIQCMLLGAAAIGFIVLGKEFLVLWLGSGYDDVYWIVLILILPALFELCVNVCLAVLRAKNMLGFRTGVLIASTVLNFVVSVAGIRYIGYFSAALGTAASFMIGSLVVMNIYYYKKLGFNMVRIYGRILHRTIICLLVAGGVIGITSRFLVGSWLTFAANVLIFGIVYTVMLLVWGCSDEERVLVKGFVRRLKR